MGFALATHLCMGTVVDTQMVQGETATGCGMDSYQRNCSTDQASHLSFQKTPCCQTEYQYLSAQIDVQSGAQEALELSPVFVTAILVLFPGLSAAALSDAPLVAEHSPPIRSHLLTPAALQVFLI